MITLKSIQNEVGQWHADKFGETTDELLSAIVAKIGEECGELVEAHCYEFATKSPKHVESEAADVAIAVMAYCSRRGIDLEQAILKKMRVNWCREWKNDSAGQWVRDKDPS